MNEKQAKKLIELNKQTYNAIADDFSHSRKYLWPEMDSLSQYIKDNDKILDLGCGNGRLIELIKGKQIDYTGLDISKKVISLAKKRYPNNHFRIGNLYNLPFANKSFDKVFAIASIHHIPSNKLRTKILEEIRRVVKPEGLIIISVWNLNKRKYLKQIKKSQKEHSYLEEGDLLKPWGKEKENLRYYHAFKKQELIDLFSNYFKVKKKKFSKYNYWLVLKPIE